MICKLEHNLIRICRCSQPSDMADYEVILREKPLFMRLQTKKPNQGLEPDRQLRKPWCYSWVSFLSPSKFTYGNLRIKTKGHQISISFVKFDLDAFIIGNLVLYPIAHHRRQCIAPEIHTNFLHLVDVRLHCMNQCEHPIVVEIAVRDVNIDWVELSEPWEHLA